MPFIDLLCAKHSIIIDNHHDINNYHHINDYHHDNHHEIDNHHHHHHHHHNHHHINDLSDDDRYRAIISDISYAAPAKSLEIESSKRVIEAINQAKIDHPEYAEKLSNLNAKLDRGEAPSSIESESKISKEAISKISIHPPYNMT